MLKKIALGLAALLIAIIAVAALKSPHYEVSREIAIQAPAEKIFPYLNSTQLADRWMPWAEEDPDSKSTFSGPESGVGSKTSWDGGKKMGTGSATIVESVANQRVGIALEYVKPMQMTQHSDYLLRTENGATVVTWKVTGENSLPGRVMCLFMNMDKMVGGMFEKGLTKLKTIVEKGGA